MRTSVCKHNEVEELIEEKRPKDFDRECLHMDLSIFSIGGMTPNQTMKLQRRVNGRIVLVLIDSGDSHNFVSECYNSNLAIVPKNVSLFIYST